MKFNSKITVKELNSITMGTAELRKKKKKSKGGGGGIGLPSVTPIVPTSKCASVVKPCPK